MNKVRYIVFLALFGLALLVSNAAPAAAKVNEYEGQHRVAVAGDPSQWG
jgi:hypothetical protein